MRTQQVQRREIPYQGADDPAKWIHSNKTHRTASEAFRDADYAQSFWRQKTEVEELLDFLASALFGGLWVLIVGAGVFGFIYWLFI
jgi:nitrate reductase NapE component